MTENTFPSLSKHVKRLTEAEKSFLLNYTCVQGENPTAGVSDVRAIVLDVIDRHRISITALKNRVASICKYTQDENEGITHSIVMDTLVKLMGYQNWTEAREIFATSTVVTRRKVEALTYVDNRIPRDERLHITPESLTQLIIKVKTDHARDH